MSLRTPAAKAIALGAALLTLLVTGFGSLATTAIAAPSLGNLTWALDAEFRAYVTGPIGQGSVTATSPASDSGTATTFTGSSNSIGSSGTGSAVYEGSVNFAAHSGALNLTFTNPTVRVASQTSAVLEVTVNGSAVDFANLDLSSASVTADSSFVTFGSTPATLTAAGAQAFGGSYQEGRVLAPVTFAIPATTAPSSSAEPSVTPSSSIEPSTSAEPSASPEPSATPEPTTPSVEVSVTEGLNGAGDTITVTGEGFLPAGAATSGARPPLIGKFTGIYVVFGKFADVWRPSEVAASSARTALSTTWAVPAESMSTIGGASRGAIELTAEGTFSTTFTVNDSSTALGNFCIYTYAGGGAVYAPFETYTPITFAPRVIVSSTASVNGAGQALTVEGRNFLAASSGATTGVRPPLAGKFTGVYVTFGKFADVWQPSQGATRTARTALASTTSWALPTESHSAVGGTAAGAIELDANGRFTTTMTVNDSLTNTGNFGIYTYPGGGATYAPFETYTATRFGTSIVDPTPEPTTEPTEPAPPPTQSKPTTVGRLTWSIESDFTDYVTGSIAKGSVSVTGASASGSSFTFVQTGGSANADAGTGTTTYGGSVRFVGHEGALDLTFASPSVRLTGPSSAVIVMTVNGQRVDLATVNLATATRTASGDAVRFSGASTTLTAAGAAAFNGFYSAGRALDPVTVTFGVGTTEVFSGGTLVVKAAVTPTTPVATTPPATEGIALDSETLERLVAGETVTITVGGFTPGELVTVTVYSTPTVLAEGLVADASGNVTWTGSLPAGLTGEHTLVFSSASTAKGIVLTIPGLATTVARCEIQKATLTWGFKESFLAYLDSTIANGAWELSPEVTEGDQGFVFTARSGDFDAQALEGAVDFGGSIRFTGHEGVLDTTVANPRVEFTAEGAFLVLDVSGTTQGGEPVNEEGVLFASIDLDGATVTSGNGATSITNAPVTLTEAGAAAFGTYPAGEALDPISLEIVGADCAVAESEAPPSPSESAEASTAEAPTESKGLAPWLAIAIALGVVLVASGVGAGVTLRTRNGAKQ